MLEIAIRDTDRTPMWNVPGTKLFLSYEAPGPIPVDISVLSLEQKKVIAHDLARGVIVGKNTEELMTPANLSRSTPPIKGGGSLAKSYSRLQLVRDPDEGGLVAVPVREAEVIAPVTPEQVKESFMFDPMEERRGVLKKFLAQHVATVKKELPGRSLSELRILKDIELNGKNRPSVIYLIDALVSKAQADVFNSIQKSYDPKGTLPVPQDLPKPYLDNVTPVIDSDHEDVTIKLGADDEE